MIKVSHSSLFQSDLESAIDWLQLFSIANGKNPDKTIEDFKQELIQQIVIIQNNPFIKASYGPNNPTRRAILLFGNFILEYQCIPWIEKRKSHVTEVLLTALVPSRSGRYRGAFDILKQYDF
jgi:hypothetical protein